MIRIRRGVLDRRRKAKPYVGHRCPAVIRIEPCCMEVPGCNDHDVRCYEPITRLRYVLAGACAEHQGEAR